MFQALQIMVNNYQLCHCGTRAVIRNTEVMGMAVF